MATIQHPVLPVGQEARYRDLFDGVAFVPGKPAKEPVVRAEGMAGFRVALAAGTELPRHHAEERVLVLCLRGKAAFRTWPNEEERGFALQPGCMVEMPPRLPHAVRAETDCVLWVVKIG